MLTFFNGKHACVLLRSYGKSGKILPFSTEIGALNKKSPNPEFSPKNIIYIICNAQNN